jgi:magnesium chelatase family protein
MLARRLSTILPPLDPDEAFEVTRIQSVTSGTSPRRLARDRPFRAPHHTASTVALVGVSPNSSCNMHLAS